MDTKLAKKIAEEAAKEAGSMLMEHFGTDIKKTAKAKSDLVTEVYIQSEKIIIDAIKKNFPEHSILSEEAGNISGEEQYTWVIDPIDGTINYSYGAAPFRVAICLLEDKKPILSVIYNHIKGHLYIAEKGKGATMNGKSILVSNNADLKNAIVMTHLSSKKEARGRTIAVLDDIFSESMHMRMFGSSIAAMTYIATGKFDVFFSVQTKPWDIVSGALLIEEAGGKVTDIQGGEISLDSNSVLATNGKVHGHMLELLKNI